MKNFIKENAAILLVILSLLAFRFIEYPIVGFLILISAIPFAARKFVQADKRDKLIAEMVELIEEKIELEDLQPLVTDKEAAEKITLRLEEIENELKVPVDELVAIGILKKEPTEE